MKFVGIALGIMLMASIIAIAFGNKATPIAKHKTDSEMIREAGAQLDAACQLNEDKC
jgi:hypothetical protein